jgi:hypothetical protein
MWYHTKNAAKIDYQFIMTGNFKSERNLTIYFKLEFVKLFVILMLRLRIMIKGICFYFLFVSSIVLPY